MQLVWRSALPRTLAVSSSNWHVLCVIDWLPKIIPWNKFYILFTYSKKFLPTHLWKWNLLKTLASTQLHTYPLKCNQNFSEWGCSAPKHSSWHLAFLFFLPLNILSGQVMDDFLDDFSASSIQVGILKITGRSPRNLKENKQTILPLNSSSKNFWEQHAWERLYRNGEFLC